MISGRVGEAFRGGVGESGDESGGCGDRLEEASDTEISEYSPLAVA